MYICNNVYTEKSYEKSHFNNLNYLTYGNIVHKFGGGSKI